MAADNGGTPGGALDGRVAVVTGASSGIGAASARLFAKAGARVVVGYNRGIDRANAVVGGLAGTGHKAMHLPLEDTAQIKRVAAAAGRSSAAPTSWSTPPGLPGWWRTATSTRSTTI
jgi:NAD(P)-dependent dehydrogenase (short-subunit alcohol dehydrogenase family)